MLNFTGKHAFRKSKSVQIPVFYSVNTRMNTPRRRHVCVET